MASSSTPSSPVNLLPAKKEVEYVNLMRPWFEYSNPFSPWFQPSNPFSDDPRPYPADELISINPYGLKFIVEQASLKIKF
ncbi:hypothetical protein DCAR_0625789 [Daucus carota subsp. sativus]|uniref:Uncharacterized protein n=1 Tax=Daucus carota subsp. sativus TaxID=79200 RepID=A0A164WPC2_DAUCS|nr:hypothetical protein DCAR_0625789 [Daucus carota subsp. sativus]